MKILDRYILTTFLKTFFPLFIIIMFILLLQTIWLFISDLAGKDLDFFIIVNFLMFATPKLIPMVLPLTVLLTSIMIFGNFAENYEFAAMKSSGISLQRAMRTLSVLMFFIGIGAFLFSNTVIPRSEKRFVNLRKNIVKVKPARAIIPNRFNNLGDVNIRVSEKYGDNDQYLKDVIIHEKSARPGNFTVIKAVDGELKGSIDSDLITLVLNDGNYYDEIQSKSPKERKKHPFAKMHFRQYVLNLDLSDLDNVDMDAQQYKKGYNMLNVIELYSQLDTISAGVNDLEKSLVAEVDRRIGFVELNKNLKIADTLQEVIKDTLDLIKDRFTTKQRVQIYNLASSNTEGLIRKFKSVESKLELRKRGLNKYEMSLHVKYVLGVSCVLLFFVGAPLGAIIRKGGLGLPMVIGVALFLTYHFIGVFAKNGAEEGVIPAFLGSWISTFLIFPLSVFLTYRATRDRGFIGLGFMIEPIKKFIQKKIVKYKVSTSYSSTERENLLIELDEKTVHTLEKKQSDFVENSNVIIVLFGILLIVNILISLISKDSGEGEIVLIVFNCLGILSYLIFFFKAYLDYTNFYKSIPEFTKRPSMLLFFVIGLPVYLGIYKYYRKKLYSDLNSVR